MDVGYISTYKKPSHNLSVTDITDLDDESRLASKVITEEVVRPVIASRKIVESEIPVIEVRGMSPMAKDNWLHSFSHKKTQNKRSEYDNIRGLVKRS